MSFSIVVNETDGLTSMYFGKCVIGIADMQGISKKHNFLLYAGQEKFTDAKSEIIYVTKSYFVAYNCMPKDQTDLEDCYCKFHNPFSLLY